MPQYSLIAITGLIIVLIVIILLVPIIFVVFIMLILVIVLLVLLLFILFIIVLFDLLHGLVPLNSGIFLGLFQLSRGMRGDLNSMAYEVLTNIGGRDRVLYSINNQIGEPRCRRCTDMVLLMARHTTKDLIMAHNDSTSRVLLM